MSKPKMIIFDAGRTLLDYTSINTRKGIESLIPYITENPLFLTVDEIDRRVNEITAAFDVCKKQLIEVPERTILTLVFELLRLKFSIGVSEIEEILWNTVPVVVPTLHARETLEKLNEMGIQTAVISNLEFSGNLLKKRLNELYPNNQFRFVIASGDYGFRKPNHYIFDAGIAKSGFDAVDIWYVGDKISVDVEGSQNAGMTPVLFKCPRNHYEYIPEGLKVMDDFLELLMLVGYDTHRNSKVH